MKRQRKQAALWQLGLGFLVYLSVIRLALFLGGLAGILVVVAGFVILGIAALRWGYDSREGRFWSSDSKSHRLRL